MMKRPEFLYQTTQIFKTFSPLNYHDLVIPPVIAALPDSMLLPFLREAGLRIKPEKENTFPDFYTFCRNPESALGYALVDLDLTRGQEILEVIPAILQSYQDTKGVQLSPLIDAFIQEREPCQKIEAWIVDFLTGQRGESVHAFL